MLRNKKACGLLGLNDHNASKLKSCSKDCTFTKGCLKKNSMNFKSYLEKLKSLVRKYILFYGFLSILKFWVFFSHLYLYMYFNIQKYQVHFFSSKLALPKIQILGFIFFTFERIFIWGDIDIVSFVEKKI